MHENTSSSLGDKRLTNCEGNAGLFLSPLVIRCGRTHTHLPRPGSLGHCPRRIIAHAHKRLHRLTPWLVGNPTHLSQERCQMNHQFHRIPSTTEKAWTGLRNFLTFHIIATLNANCNSTCTLSFLFCTRKAHMQNYIIKTCKRSGVVIRNW